MKDTEENQELSKQLNQYFKLMISFTSSADQAINRTVACTPSPHPKGKQEHSFSMNFCLFIHATLQCGATHDTSD